MRLIRRFEMWERLIEVLAVYGAGIAVLIGCAHFWMKNKTIDERNEFFFTISTGWTAMALGLGAVYALTGFGL